jgi:hypothetical protein
MLQIVAGLFILFWAGLGQAQAQDGVVTSLQRAGGVPTYVLDRLNALEAQYNTLSSTLSGYTTTVVTNPASCGASQVFAGTCQAMPSARRLTEISLTSTTVMGDLTAYGAAVSTSMSTRVHGFLNNASGCPTASGWSYCTADQLKQAHTLRVTGYNPASSSLARFIALDPGYLLWAGGGADLSPEAVVTTSCSAMTSSSAAADYTHPFTVLWSIARHNYRLFTGCGSAFAFFCCRTQ